MDYKRFVRFVACAMVTGGILAGCNEKKGEFGAEQKKQVQELIEAGINDLLENHQERLLIALDKAMQKQQQQAAKRVETIASDEQAQFWESKLVIGNKEAQVRLCVFFDPLDPVSQKFQEDVMSQIVKERSDVGFFLIPVSVFGPTEKGTETSSVDAARAIIAASWQSPAKAIALWSKFPPITQEMSRTVILRFAKEVELDADKLAKDMDGLTSQDELIKNGMLARKLEIPPQLPVIFIRNHEGKMDLIPPFIKDKLVVVLDAVRDGKKWQKVWADELKKEQGQLKEKMEQGQNKEAGAVTNSVSGNETTSAKETNASPKVQEQKKAGEIVEKSLDNLLADVTEGKGQVGDNVEAAGAADEASKAADIEGSAESSAERHAEK